ncbi:MAG: heat shock protein 40 [Pedosphaera sp.]|nr:heat shock protein 40 [Pedosphaera sp.]
MVDHYQILGVPSDATLGEIKKSFRQRVKKYHPDLNHGAEAAGMTRQLNASYRILCNARARADYDMDAKVAASTREKTEASATPNFTAAGFSFQAEATICCERCRQVDSSLRIGAVWVVFSFITYSRKISAVKILCVRCRVVETLAASAVTLVLGWWSLWGIFWTMEALVANAFGGDQPEENNGALLKALSHQLYRTGNAQEAYAALSRGMQLRPDAKWEPTLEFLKEQAGAVETKNFWRRFVGLGLEPFFYHALFASVGIALVVYAVS